jgi:outer membrane protein TolC
MTVLPLVAGVPFSRNATRQEASRRIMATSSCNSFRAYRRTGALAAAALALFVSPAAHALQPLDTFVEHARTWSPDNRSAQATTAQRDAEVSTSTGNLLPNLQLTGTYTRNQYEVSFSEAGLVPGATGSLVIQPLNQVDGSAVLTIPLINVGTWDKQGAAKATLASSKANVADVARTTKKSVTRDYFQLLGYEAVLRSATQNLDVARHNTKLAQDKMDSGTGSQLDVQRALADQAKAEQNVSAADLNVVDARRSLYSLTGVAPEPATAFPEAELTDEAPLAGWMSGAASSPAVAYARAHRVAAEKTAEAAGAAWYPTASAVGTEKVTNATGFVGHADYYLLQLTASWKLDATLSSQARAQGAAADAARADEDKARLGAEDDVYKDWQQIRADIASSRSARAQVTATKLAASIAEDRYVNGVATQLDLLQARQDAFAAEVSRIQADSDLAYARSALRLDSGRNSGQPTAAEDTSR